MTLKIVRLQKNLGAQRDESISHCFGDAIEDNFLCLLCADEPAKVTRAGDVPAGGNLLQGDVEPGASVSASRRS